MADRDAVKRSQSSKVKSLLGRVSSRQDDQDSSSAPSRASSDTKGSTAASVPSVPSTLSSSSPSVRGSSQMTSRHRPHLSTTMSSTHQNQSSPASANPQEPGLEPPSPTSQGASVEQSVRMFRIFEALRNGDTAAIDRAVRGGNDEQGEGDGQSGGLEGTTVLHLAIQCAEQPVIEHVIALAGSGVGSGIDLNGIDKDGNTPLHIAAMLGRAPIVTILLQHDVVNDAIANYAGRTPLDVARTPEIYQQLQLSRAIYVDAQVRKIHQLIAHQDFSTLEQILTDPHVKATIDVNSGELVTDPMISEARGTLLHEAAKKKDTKLIQILLLNGADPFRRDRKGKLPQDITKDDRTRTILKKSPAAAAAQRGIQEKAIMGSGPGQPTAGPGAGPDGGVGNKEAREMKGYLKKWTNYTTGYKLRWFVLEDGVLSYYKHQDDAGSACRGAINMRIANLHMDPQDKLRFEIHGKSSVKYHLKANHQVEAKRWYWALNNAIQWAKDEEKEEQKRTARDGEALRQVRSEQLERIRTSEDGESVRTYSRGPGGMESSTGLPDSVDSRSIADNDAGHLLGRTHTGAMGPTAEDEEEDYGDDASSHEIQPSARDAFNIAAQSAKIQLELLAQISKALQSQKSANPQTTISEPVVWQALTSYDAAVSNLRGLIGDLLRISRDRDNYWQHRLDREANVRQMWEESMARVAREQEALENRIGESEQKRRATRRALRDALDGQATMSPGPQSPAIKDEEQVRSAMADMSVGTDGTAAKERTPTFATIQRRSTVIDLEQLAGSDDDDDDDEFFDAVDAGEVEVVEAMPTSPRMAEAKIARIATDATIVAPKTDISSSFRGYEDGPRPRLKIDADNRPKVSLWAVLKSMIGKDMTKMTLPVTFNEPTSLLFRVAEDMEYTELLDTAAGRDESTERLVYVSTFAASCYASTVGRVAKPFNPLLGETYEYVRPDKNYRFFVEQVSHHPPIGAGYAESPHWDYWGESAVKSKFYGKSFDFNPLGTWFLRLRPTNGGTPELYTWKKVTSSVGGIITGSPTVDNYGPMEIRNWTTGEVCQLDFKPRGWKASSAFQVAGKVLDADGNPKWSIGGRWNDKIYARLTPGFEASVEPVGKTEPGLRSPSNNPTQAFLVWEANPRPANIPFNLTPFVVTLNAIPDRLRPFVAPTDTRLRPDQRAMEEAEYDTAADEKSRLEDKQRKKRRDREAAGEEFVPKWFYKAKDKETGESYWQFKLKSEDNYWATRDRVANGEAKWDGCEDIF